MSDTVIKVEELSKQYRLGQIGTGTISHDINRWWHKIRGNEDPYLKIGEVNDRTQKGTSEYVWALQDINFDVKQGEVLGIIGRNGAGKSTLLKILSRTTSPTTGHVKVKGRVASLLEVGTGFHPELSGRENVFLNGAILGMTKKEIKSKFDEIVDFAGVERYIDTPVKRYSSGMYVRLAFGVAAHLESEILIVDEVLAVGDAEFQKKALGKMKNVSTNEGRTVLFVSHNMNSLEKLCSKGILMEFGKIKIDGNLFDCIKQYRKTESFSITEYASENVRISGIHVSAGNNNLISATESVSVEFDFFKYKDKQLYFVVAITKNDLGIHCASNLLDNCDFGIKENNGHVKLVFDKIKLLPGEYQVVIGIKDATGNDSLADTKTITTFNVINDFEERGLINSMGNQLENITAPFVPYKWYFNNEEVKGNLNIIDEIFWRS